MDRSRDVTVYKKWDDGFSVRSMTSDDAKIVENWYNEICPTGNDLEIALDVSDPSGKFFFVGELDGQVIASIANVPVCDGGLLLYLSVFYVEEKYRKHGCGRRIMDEVAGAAVGDATVLALDSHAELEAMQQRRGCSSAFHVTLYEGRVKSAEGQRSDATVKTFDLESDFDSLVAYDDGCFIRPGSQQRRRLLKRWTTIPGGKTVVAFRGTGSDGGGGERRRRVVGFGCRRPSLQNGNHLIGPLYADDAGVAWDIVGSLVSDIAGEKIWINICETNAEAVRLISRDLKLTANLHMIRMYKNGNPGQMSDKVFAITSIDICGF